MFLTSLFWKLIFKIVFKGMWLRAQRQSLEPIREYRAPRPPPPSELSNRKLNITRRCRSDVSNNGTNYSQQDVKATGRGWRFS